jgi:hypothetical protein
VANLATLIGMKYGMTVPAEFTAAMKCRDDHFRFRNSPTE